MLNSGFEIIGYLTLSGQLRSVVFTQAVNDVIAGFPDQAEQVRAGEEKVIGFLVGQVMKATSGKANPQAVNELLKKQLLD